MAHSPDEIRAKYQNLRKKLVGITPTLDREVALFLAEMLTEVAAQQAELNQNFRKEEKT
jgi:hypothetical protein